MNSSETIQASNIGHSNNTPAHQKNPSETESVTHSSRLPSAMQEPAAARTRVRLTGTLINVFVVATITYLRGHRWMRFFAAILGSLLLAAWILGFPGFRSEYFLAGGVLLIFAAAVGSSREVDFFISEPEEVLERREIEERLRQQGTANPYEFLDLDSKRLSEYYAINQGQARSGFRWALIVMLLGFGTIIGGVWLFYLRPEAQDKTLTTLSIVAGLVTDFIAATFIYLNNNTQKQSLHYYGRLTSLQNLALSIRLADAHEDAGARATARNKIIDRLLELSSAGDITSAIPGLPQQRHGAQRVKPSPKAKASGNKSSIDTK